MARTFLTFLLLSAPFSAAAAPRTFQFDAVVVEPLLCPGMALGDTLSWTLELDESCLLPNSYGCGAATISGTGPDGISPFSLPGSAYRFVDDFVDEDYFAASGASPSQSAYLQLSHYFGGPYQPVFSTDVTYWTSSARLEYHGAGCDYHATIVAITDLAADPCPLDPDDDADADGLCGDVDNCPSVDNAGQSDADADGVGDACDTDADNDGVDDVADNCMLVANAGQADFDGDWIGDACDTDGDGDGVLDDLDACPDTALGEVVDTDGCSLDQAVPCGGAWKNHGAYVGAVSSATRALVRDGVLTEAERTVRVSAAAQSGCGR